MALTTQGLTVETFQEVLDAIITSLQEEVSPSIEVGDDTALGQANQIFATQISLANELIQDIYDQRDINKAEGKALDDNVSWLGITRQAESATAGEQLFTGDDNTTVVLGSLIGNDSTGDLYALDNLVLISRNKCRAFEFIVITLDVPNTYTVTVQGIDFDYAAQPSDTEFDIVDGLALLIDVDSNLTSTSTDDGVNSFGSVTVNDNTDVIASTDTRLRVSQATTSGDITGVVTGPISAPKDTLTVINTPTSGWTSTNNFAALNIGRNEETDAELRTRAINFRASTGTATVTAMVSGLLQLSGVSSATINEQFVGLGVGGTDIAVLTAVNLTLYTLFVNGDATTGDQIDFTSDASATVEEIAAGLTNEINVVGLGLYTAVDNLDGTLTVLAPSLNAIEVITTEPQLDSAVEVTEGQPAGSIQCVVAGGVDDDIAQQIYDTKPAGVEVWALRTFDFDSEIPGTARSANAKDINGENVLIEWNSPSTIDMITSITFEIFDTSAYPEDSADAILAVQNSVIDFGNALGAGEDVFPAQFEQTVYSAVSGISNVLITINGVPSVPVGVPVPVDSDEEALFTIANITVVGTPI